MPDISFPIVGNVNNLPGVRVAPDPPLRMFPTVGDETSGCSGHRPWPTSPKEVSINIYMKF